MPTIAEPDSPPQPTIYIHAVNGGESVILSGSGQPAVMLIPLTASVAPHPVGLFVGQFHVPEDFNDPLPEEILSLFDSQIF